MVVFFFAGWPIAKVAIIAGALLLVTRRVRPEQIYAQVDWSLLVLFAGLFIVVAGIEKSSLQPDLVRLAGRVHLENGGVLSAVAAVLSNLVSNVPAVLVFKPFMPHLANPMLGWLRLAMSSTLAGNLTILGSIANLIVVERSRGVAEIGFWEYSRGDTGGVGHDRNRRVDAALESGAAFQAARRFSTGAVIWQVRGRLQTALRDRIPPHKTPDSELGQCFEACDTRLN